MAILIGSDPAGSAIVPMLEREGLRVEITVSPEQALKRLQEIVQHHPGEAEPGAEGWPGTGEGGNGSRFSEEGAPRQPWESAPEPSASLGEPPELPGRSGEHGAERLDRRLWSVQERARLLEGEEQKIIGEALQHAGGNKTAAARLLGISRYALQRRLRRFAKPQAAPPP